MGITIDYAPGATPLDPDEAEALIPKHISTQAQLNEWEFRNILQGEQWALSRMRRNLLSTDFLLSLHQRMFNDTWKWAGTFRKTEKSIGAAPENIAVGLRNLWDDVKTQLEYRNWPMDEIAARFHHRLVSIHPFPNGNGRHSRLMADLLLLEQGQERFTWGDGDMINNTDVRRRYIEALGKADKRDYFQLLGFVRSQG